VTFYGYQVRDYDSRPSDDSDSYRVEGGISWKISAKSRGTARAGYMQADYPRLDRTDDAISYAVDLTHELRPKTLFFLEGVREILDTSRADDNLGFSNSYVSTQVSATLTHRYRKLTGRLKAGLIRDEYLHDDIASGKERRDHLFTGEFGVDHVLRKWLTLGGSYRYSRLNSNFDTEEYTENIFLFHVSLIL
jgi:hypothetical protein